MQVHAVKWTHSMMKIKTEAICYRLLTFISEGWMSRKVLEKTRAHDSIKTGFDGVF